jgi:hypothetical protein
MHIISNIRMRGIGQDILYGKQYNAYNFSVDVLITPPSSPFQPFESRPTI